MSRWRSLTCLGGCAGVALILGWAAARPTVGAPVPKEKPEREIPLKEIHTLSPQVGLPRLGLLGQDESIVRGVQAIEEALQLHSASNLFLVRGDDLKAAVQDARSRVTFEDNKETAAEKKARETSNRRWLFVYLGFGPSRPMPAKLEAVRVYSDRVQVRYSKPDPADRFQTTDVRYYAYWIPLGELRAGTISLEVVDHATDDVELMRKESIPAPKQAESFKRR